MGLEATRFAAKVPTLGTLTSVLCSWASRDVVAEANVVAIRSLGSLADQLGWHGWAPLAVLITFAPSLQALLALARWLPGNIELPLDS